MYRKRFFELLNSTSAHEYVVFHSEPPTGSGQRSLAGPFGFPDVRVKSREFRLGSRMVIYQPVGWRILIGNFDAVIIGHEIKFPVNILLFFLFKAQRKAALLWGFGYHAATSSLPARLSSRFLARAANGYLAYTSGGAERLRQAGVADDRITMLRNTVDIDGLKEAHAQHMTLDSAVVQAELGLRPEAQTLFFIGRLREIKRVDELLKLVRRLNDDASVSPVDLLIVGDGPLRADLEAQVADLTYAKFLGVRSDTEVASFMRVASATVINASIGLAVNHSFSQGVPMITRADVHHNPEVEYLRHGENGLAVEGDFDDFVAAVTAYLKDPAMHARHRAASTTARRGDRPGRGSFPRPGLSSLMQSCHPALAKRRRGLEGGRELRHEGHN